MVTYFVEIGTSGQIRKLLRKFIYVQMTVHGKSDVTNSLKKWALRYFFFWLGPILPFALIGLIFMYKHRSRIVILDVFPSVFLPV